MTPKDTPHEPARTSPDEHVRPVDGHPEPPLGTPPEGQETTMIRAFTGEGREAEADAPAPGSTDDLPKGVAHDPDPSRDLKVAGDPEPHDSIDKEMERARAATAAGKPVGTINDPNSVTTLTEVEPKEG